jgi:hypothetical protein
MVPLRITYRLTMANLWCFIINVIIETANLIEYPYIIDKLEVNLTYINNFNIFFIGLTINIHYKD